MTDPTPAASHPTARPLAPLWLSGSVRRWHCNPALSNSHQTNADHQGRCVLLLLALHPDPSVALIRAVASHDVGEMMVGDLPGPFKRMVPGLAQQHADHEALVRQSIFGLEDELAPEDALWLQLLDQLDAHCWCLTQNLTEYQRAASGWLDAETRLEQRAKDLGCWDQVAQLLADLFGGQW